MSTPRCGLCHTIGNTTISTAAESSCRQEQLARWLLAFHADPNVADLRRRTPLHHAALQGTGFFATNCVAVLEPALQRQKPVDFWQERRFGGFRMMVFSEDRKDKPMGHVVLLLMVVCLACNLRDLYLFRCWKKDFSIKSMQKQKEVGVVTYIKFQPFSWYLENIVYHFFRQLWLGWF